MYLLFSFLIFSSVSLTAQKSAVYISADQAIHGYDPVAYFKEHKPVKGDPKYAYVWNGATWIFSTQQNLDAFKLNPAYFAPQYGGYCAYGLADGHKAPTDPQAWTIVDNKLYLNYDKDVQQKWNKNQGAYILQANTNWTKIKNKD